MSHQSQRDRTISSTSAIGVVSLAVVALTIAAGYVLLSGPKEATEREIFQRELEINRALWLERRPNDFRYVISRICFCGSELTRPYLVTHSGERVTVEYVEPGSSQPVAYASPPSNPVVIDDVFPILEVAIATAYQLRVEYNQEYGFPAYLYFDPYVETTDGHDGYEIQYFSVALDQ